MYVMSDDWSEEFENLLCQLCRSHVNVIETYSGCRFEQTILENSFDLTQVKVTIEWARAD